MTLRAWSPFLIATVCLFVVGCEPEQKTGNAVSADSPEGLVKNVETALQEMHSFSFGLDVSMEVTAQGVEQKMDSDYDVKIERPNRWAVLLKSGMMGGSSVSDGMSLTKFAQMLQKYTVEPLDENALSLTTDEGPNQSFIFLGAGAFTPLFMGEGLEDWLLTGVTSSKFLEDEEIDGVKCRVVRFEKKDGMQLELAVEKGPIPLVRQVFLQPDFEGIAEQQPGMPKGMKLKLILSFKDWKTEAQFTADDFVFTPPAGAQKVDSLFAQLGGGQELHSLVGEQAPAFSATDLDGETVHLEQFAGHDVVILDFWATWCGPCIDALPIIAKVAKAFQDKHVVFFAVNQGESPETIREFLTSENLEVPVMLDQEGTIGNLFQVSGIPQTVLIDTKGRVQVVHVGFGGGMEKQLTEELEDILAGKDLASAALGEEGKD